MTSRNGRPADLLDQALADLRRIWGDNARIDVVDNDEGDHIVNVRCENSLPWTHHWAIVDTRTIKAR